MAAKEKSTFSQFFKEDAEILQDTIYGQNGEEITTKVGTTGLFAVPSAPRLQ